MSFVRKKLTKNYKKVEGFESLYHFTAKFHSKAPALMHSNKGFPLLMNKKKHSLKAFKHLEKNSEPISESNLHRLIVFKAILWVLEGVFGFVNDSLIL